MHWTQEVDKQGQKCPSEIVVWATQPDLAAWIESLPPDAEIGISPDLKREMRKAEKVAARRRKIRRIK